MDQARTGELSAPMEDYLEAIYHLQAQAKVARVKDIAEQLHVSRGTVSAALKSLGERGYIDYEPYSYVTLKESGRVVAEEIIRRHEALKEFFGQVLRLEEGRAEDNACRVEHAMDRAAVDRLVDFLAFLKDCPRVEADWRVTALRTCRSGLDPARCPACLAGGEGRLAK